MTKRILSIDCATKSMGIFVADVVFLKEKYVKQAVFLVEICNKLRSRLSSKHDDYVEFTADELKKLLFKARKLNELIEQSIRPIYYDVIDLIPEMKVNRKNYGVISNRLVGLATFLKSFKPDIVLLEEQMSFNDKSNIVCDQLYALFSTSPDYDFKPIRKKGYEEINSVVDRCVYDVLNSHSREVHLMHSNLKNTVSIDTSVAYSKFIDKYKTLYLANKSHTKHNLLRWIEKTGNTDIVDKIPMTYMDDLADAFMQLFVYAFKMKSFVYAAPCCKK